MFLYFTPFSFLFLFVYMIVLLFLFSVSNFYVFWLYMELMMLLFMGVCYTLFSNSYTQLMLYFLIQTVGSFNLLVFYLLDIPFLFMAGLFLKLAMFPFFSWYINVLYRFPNFPLFLASTFHKIPPFLIFMNFFSYSVFQLVLVGSLATLFVSGIFMLSTTDLRYLLIVSSMGNNSWMLMSSSSLDFLAFFSFFFLYSLNFYFIINSFGNSAKLSVFFSRYNTSQLLFLFVLLANMAAIPPLPMFFLKLQIVNSFLLSSMFYSVSIMLLIMFLNVMMAVSYIQCFMKFVVNSYTSPANFLL